jgi:hypothetical protein
VKRNKEKRKEARDVRILGLAGERRERVLSPFSASMIELGLVR